MREGDLIIWDSGSGFDSAIFNGISSQYHHSIITTISGTYPGKMEVLNDELYPFSEELIEKLKKKYSK